MLSVAVQEMLPAGGPCLLNGSPCALYSNLFKCDFSEGRRAIEIHLTPPCSCPRAARIGQGVRPTRVAITPNPRRGSYPWAREDWRLTVSIPTAAIWCSARALRLPFETRIANGEEARREFVRLVGVARAKRTSGESIWAPFGP